MKQLLLFLPFFIVNFVNAAEITEFKNGDVADAEAINHNFRLLQNSLNALQGQFTELQAAVQALDFDGDGIGNGRDAYPHASLVLQRTYLGFSGAMASIQVPEGTQEVTFELFGAQGGDEESGGLGGYVKATLVLDQTAELHAVVGGAGFGNGSLNGFNGGGSDGLDRAGGGATDIRFGGTGLGDRILVAGGGGQRAFLGGTGFLPGGDGGGLVGGTGSDVSGASGGAGGSQSAGGAGGLGSIRNGGAGTLGLGGRGDDDNGHGGGGYFGGGGGGSSGGLLRGGGGGGSSYASPLAQDVLHIQSINQGNGKIVVAFKLEDSDGDGAPDTCEQQCIAVGMSVDLAPDDPSRW